MLFTDGSADPESKVGYGAYVLISDLKVDPETVKSAVKIKRFENTSSTRLEIETVLWALHELRPDKITLYSDSRNLIDLPDRRDRLEKKNFCSN